eukprot:scaffold46555_cov33-Tisochrysis_lutea.AAC.2
MRGERRTAQYHLGCFLLRTARRSWLSRAPQTFVAITPNDGSDAPRSQMVGWIDEVDAADWDSDDEREGMPYLSPMVDVAATLYHLGDKML